MRIAIKSKKIYLSSENEIQKLTKKILTKLKFGDIIFLYGEIGVGKTTFVRYLVNELQKKNKIKLSQVTSPTFNLLNEYKINDFKIIHYDLFRLESSKELKNLNLFEDRSKAITLVEWPQLLEKRLKNVKKIIFNYENNFQKRSVQIKGLKI
tara:strand:+ start:974 stop:1429 length:456 start_codon:yes stop_codon:yes gene_type:complete